MPERTPALFTLIYVGGFALVILLLLLSLIRNRRQVVSAIPEDLPKEVRKRLGSHSTNRGLRALRWLFVLLSIGLFVSHLLGRITLPNKREVSELSDCVRRLSESTLRAGLRSQWRVDQPLALLQTRLERQHPARIPDGQGAGPSLRIGSRRSGIERASFAFRAARFRKRSRSLKAWRSSSEAIRTCDSRSIALQQAAVDQLKGKHGAVVVLNPQNGDVLAMYSEPSYSLLNDEATWIRLEANERDKPLVSRALGAYYIPGSTQDSDDDRGFLSRVSRTRSLRAVAVVTMRRPART